MATIKLCDWFKTKLSANEATVKVQVGDKEFEVSEQAARSLLERLEADNLPEAPLLNFPPNVRSTTPQGEPQPVTPPPVIRVEPVEPFEAGPGSLPEPVQCESAEPVQLEIPQDLNKRLGVPSKATWERVIQDAKRFEPGTLPALSPGGARSAANKKLEEIEAAKESNLRREAGSDVNVKSLK